MPDEIRFSEFPETKEMKQESVIPIVQSGKNMKIAFENFAKWIGISEEKIAQAVEAYLKENSLETGATQEQVAQINENTLAIDRLYKAVSEKEDAGTAESKVSSHNTSTDSHNDIRLLLQNTINTLNAFLDADEETLNQASEMIAYMKDNRGLIEQVTTNKVSVSDIVDNYTTNISNKPVSAAVAVKLKALIDAIIVPTQLAQLAGDATHRTVTDAEKQSWNNKSNFSGSYNDLDDKPDIPSLTGYATENYVKDYAQPKGNYLTEHQDISHKADLLKVATYITPEMYGAKGDGTTDDSTAIQQAIDNAGKTAIVYLARKTYKISTGLQITHSGYKFICDGTLSYDGADSAITVGSHTVSVDIDTISAPNGTAILVKGDGKYIERCDINVRQIISSKIGLHVYTNTVSITYNKFKIGYVVSTETGILVQCDASYINENWYWLGKVTGCNIGIKLHSDSSLSTVGGQGTNDNHFFSGSLEGIQTDGIAIHLDHTCGNKFDNFRLQEHYGSTAIKFNGVCRNNDIKLSRISTKEIDVSGLEENSHSNIIQSTQVSDIYNGYNLGNKVDVSYKYGVVYDAYEANVEYELTTDLFADNVIKQINTLIPTVLYINNDAIDNLTFALDGLYSDFGSMVRGFPITLIFGANVGKILLVDNKGATILDNTSGAYSEKTVSVKWNGFDKNNNINIWDVQVLGERYLTKHQDISGKANKSDAETWIFTLSDGSIVTKKVVLA